jgi:hypothetical protein
MIVSKVGTVEHSEGEGVWHRKRYMGRGHGEGCDAVWHWEWREAWMSWVEERNWEVGGRRKAETTF